MNIAPGFSVRVRNFASFTDSDAFTIGQGINTFIGLNNVGKTALLYSLAGLSISARKANLPYPLSNIGEVIKRYKRAEGDPVIEVEIPLSSGRTEILKTLCSLASQPQFPATGDDRDRLRFVWVLGDEPGLANIHSAVYRDGKLVEKELLRVVAEPSDATKVTVIVAEHPYGSERPNTYQPPKFDITSVPTRSDLRPFKFKEANQLSQLWPTMFESVVLLSTHRNPPSRAQHNYATAIDPVASNLAQVLATIQMSSPEVVDGREIFDAIQEEIVPLFPEIRRIRTEIVPGDRSGQALEVEVKLDLRSGATVPLSHSGTGIQQILALLTGAFVSKNGSLFLLDEPHSYLHPAAERGLISVLERVGQQRGHYFCIATHSPIFASYSRSHLYAIRTTNEGSKVRNIASAAEILDVLGVSNPDLFTYSRVVLVEGISDEKVIRAITDKLLDAKAGHRLKIQAIGGDGILKNRSRAEFIALLHKANVSEVQVPIRFVLDSNDWSTEERQKLSALVDGDGKPVVHFLVRPELENYLLHAEAVLHALKERLAARSLSSTTPTVAAVEQLINSKRNAKGSDVLNEIFAQYGCDYSKNKDGDVLLAFILATCPSHLNPLIDELSGPLELPTDDKKQSAKAGRT